MVSLKLDTDCHWSLWCWIIIPIVAPPADSITYIFKFLPNLWEQATSLPTLLGYLLKENRLTLGEKVNDLLNDDEALWLKYVEKLDETKSIWLVNSATAVALVARDRAGLDVCDTLADVLWNWLVTFKSVGDGEILKVKFAMRVSDAGKDENKSWVSRLVNNLKDFGVLHLHYPYAASSHGVFHCSAR